MDVQETELQIMELKTGAVVARIAVYRCPKGHEQRVALYAPSEDWSSFLLTVAQAEGPDVQRKSKVCLQCLMDKIAELGVPEMVWNRDIPVEGKATCI